MSFLRYAASLLVNERGAFNFIPWLLGLTSLLNLGHRQRAQATLEEDVIPPEQIQGSVIQGFANRGLNVGPASPAVQEALRRQSLAKRQQKAQGVLAGPDPFSILFGLFRE